MMNLEVYNNEGVGEIKRLCAQYGISPMELSIYLQVTKVRIYEILSGKRRITPETDILLCHFFKLENGYFASRQLDYDLMLAQRQLSQKLEKIATYDKTVKG